MKIPTKPKSNLKLAQIISKKEDTSSRTEIAREAGVSVKTITSILDKTLELAIAKECAKKKPSRQKLGGVINSLTRLAKLCHKNPKIWVEEIGIEMDAYAKNAIQISEKRIERRDLKSGKNILDRMREKERVDVGILSYGCFSKEIVGHATFFEEYAKRVIGTIFPRLDINLKVNKNPHDLIQKLVSSKYDVAFGVASMVEREAKKLKFIPIPGFKIALSAISVRGKEDLLPEHIDWSYIVNQDNFKEYQAIVIEDESGDIYMRGTCQYTQTVKISSIEPSLAAQELVKKVQATDLPSILIADHETATGIAEEVEKLLDKEVYKVDPLESIVFRDQSPRHQISAVTMADHQVWYDLLQRSTTEIFLTSPDQLITLYSKLIRESRRKKCLRLVDFDRDGNPCKKFKKGLWDETKEIEKQVNPDKKEGKHILPPEWEYLEKNGKSKQDSFIRTRLSEIEKKLDTLIKVTLP